MKTSFFIARKYFLSKKKQNFINVLSWIGLSGVALGSAALVIVLSVFNGLESLLKDLFASFDPDIKIELKEGKYFELDQELQGVFSSMEGISGVVHVLEDNALVQYRNNHSIVKVKGVDEEYLKLSGLEEKIVEGQLQLFEDGYPRAIIGRGVQYQLSVPANERFYPLRIMVPKKLKKVRISPEQALTEKSILPSGVFAIEEQFDNTYVLVPYGFAEELFKKEKMVSSIELFLDESVDKGNFLARLKKNLPENMVALGQYEQHLALFRAIKLEKLFVNLAFLFLLLIISFNIFFALSMLALEKKKDLGMLAAMGANPKTVFLIFLLEGGMIGFFGVFCGLLLGGGLGYFQEYHGLVSMGLENAVADAYPLKMQLADFVLSGVLVLTITILASLNPAMSAVKIAKRNSLDIS